MIAQSAPFFDVENASPGQASFVCWRDRVPYDEAIYLNTLKRRGSPLASKLHLTLAYAA
jgi:hypothetical protein